MAAAALRRSAKTTRSKSSDQSWPPNSGHVTEDGSRNPALVLPSEQQQLSASILTLPQQQNQQAGTQMQFAYSMDQPQIGSDQYQPTGNNPEPPTTDASGQYQPAGNNETPIAGDDLNSNVIVYAQLTHVFSRDDAAQGQDAPNVPDVPMPDAPAVHDIATPRRMIGGKCRKWCINAQPASGKRKCAACNLCGIRFTHCKARLQQWGNRETNHLSNLPRGSGLRCSKLNMPFSGPSFITTPPLWRQSQLGKRWCSAGGSFWDDLQSTPLRATAHFLDTRLELFWADDWSALWAMVRAECDVAPVQNTTRRMEFAKSLH